MKTPSPSTMKSSYGEPKIWLCALGLTVGLGMTALLMLLIVVRGLEVFWPKDVVQFTLKPAQAGGKGEIIAGEVRKQQMRRDAGTGKDVEEWLVFMGNKDAYGQTFRFIDHHQIEQQELPADLMMADRLGNGKALFYPVSLKLVGGREIAAGDAKFDAEFHRLIREGNDRRKQIETIEKVQIGAINRRMLKLDNSLKNLAANEAAQEARQTDVAAQKKALQVEYETLAAKASALRQEQTKNTLNYRLASGQARSQPLGEVISYYRPNRLDFAGKAGWFFRNGWDFLSGEPRESNTEGGIFPAIFGTFVMTLIMSVLVTPFGVIAAIYLREYAKQGLIVRAVRISVNNLAGVPSIVFGVFGLGFFIYTVGATIDQLFFSTNLPTPTFGTGGILWSAFTLALLTLPVVIVASEEALGAVPRGVREAALACGASKWQTIQRVVLPSALPGILTGVILSMARGAGEVAPLMLVGVVKLAPSLPLDLVPPFVHAERKFMHLGFHIFDLGFQSPDSEAAKPMVFATTLLLIVLVVILNLAAILLRNRLRKRYALSTF
ncbi:MAG: phosphate transporter, inner rane subunit PstA [Verrucomicrobiaceae bacterium]|nr:phosphate transporter, inner rane subunit PstA [Verrucomicrobiaceae bacterium]